MLGCKLSKHGNPEGCIRGIQIHLGWCQQEGAAQAFDVAVSAHDPLLQDLGCWGCCHRRRRWTRGPAPPSRNRGALANTESTAAFGLVLGQDFAVQAEVKKKGVRVVEGKEL